MNDDKRLQFKSNPITEFYDYDFWVGFSIYISHKSSYRRSTMQGYGLCYHGLRLKLKAMGLIKGNNLKKKLASELWGSTFPNTLASQTHQVIYILNQLTSLYTVV